MDIKKSENIENFRLDVVEKLKDHEERLSELNDKINWEEISHLLLIIIEKVQYEQQENRRKEYAKLFVNSILMWNQFNFDERRMFIQLFSELSDNDIIYLGKIYEASKYHLKTIHQDGAQLSMFSPNLITKVPYILRLESKGLVYELIYPLVISIPGEAKNDYDSEWINKVYGLTPLGKSFCKFLID